MTQTRPQQLADAYEAVAGAEAGETGGAPMTTKLVEWTGRNGKRRSAILHAETANDPDKFRQWCAWNGYTPPPAAHCINPRAREAGWHVAFCPCQECAGR